MAKARLIRAAFLVTTCAALFGLPAVQQRPATTVYRSLLDDLTPEPNLKSLAAASVDFRGCDGGGGPAVDFWTLSVGLFPPSDSALSLVELSVDSANREDP